MKKNLLNFFVFLFTVVSFVPSSNAGKFTLTVLNEIDDKDDPMILQTVSVAIGTIEHISHQEGEAIGKEFKVTLTMPEIEVTSIVPYLESLEKKTKN